MGMSENSVPLNPMVNDHYPVFKWLAIIGNINPTFSVTNPCFDTTPSASCSKISDLGLVDLSPRHPASSGARRPRTWGRRLRRRRGGRHRVRCGGRCRQRERRGGRGRERGRLRRYWPPENRKLVKSCGNNVEDVLSEPVSDGSFNDVESQSIHFKAFNTSCPPMLLWIRSNDASYIHSAATCLQHVIRQHDVECIHLG